jgi:hypothetical protein
MPNCFQLYKRGEQEPSVLQKVDEAMCKHFDTFCDPKHWHHNWYNIIGFGYAMGQSYVQQRDRFINDRVVAEASGEVEQAKGSQHYINILDWLWENYTVNAFVGIGKQ